MIMKDRPPIVTICYITAEGNPSIFTVGSAGVTEIREVEEFGEYSAIPWVEIYKGEFLTARFCQHKLEYILYS